MNIAPGGTYFGYMTTRNPSSGALQNADSTPTVAVERNGSSVSPTFTTAVTNVSTGRYRYAFTVDAGYTAGDVIRVFESATVDGLPGVQEKSFTVDATIAAINTKLGTPANVTVSADIAAVKTDTGNLVTRITANLFSGITYMSRWLGALAGKTADTAVRAEINATTAGAGYNETTDSMEATRDAMPSAVVAAFGGTSITYNGPVADTNEVTLYEGCDYSGAKALSWTITGWTGASVNGEACTLTIMSEDRYDKGYEGADLTITTGTLSQTGSTVSVSVPITKAQIATLQTTPPLKPQGYVLRVISNTTEQPLIDTTCTVKKGTA